MKFNNKLLFGMLFLIFFISFVSAAVNINFNNDNVPKIILETPTTTSNGFGGNVTAFLDLTDTPASYTGSGNLCVAVNGAEDGLEFVTCGNGTAGYNHTSIIESVYGKWFYNQTAPAITYINSLSFLSSAIANETYAGIEWNYNQTTPAIAYTDILNASYNKFWYNMTIASEGTNHSLILETAYGKWWYNQSAPVIIYVDNKGYVTSSIANATYAGIAWSYNMTTPAITFVNALNNSYNKFWYNMTVASAGINHSLILENAYKIYWNNQTLPAINYVDALNASYNKFWYNMTIASEGTNHSLILETAYRSYWNNQTAPYEKWFNNQTTPAITFVNALNNSYNKFWYNMTIATTGNTHLSNFTDDINATANQLTNTNSNVSFGSYKDTQSNSLIKFDRGSIIIVLSP